MFEVSVSGSSLAELRGQLVALVGQIDGATEGEPTPDNPPATEGKRGRGRPAKAAQEAPTQEAPAQAAPVAAEAPAPATAPAAMDPFAAPAEASKPAPVKSTFEQVKAALQELAKQRTGDKDAMDGLARVTKVLEKFNLRLVKDIPEDKYAEVFAAAQAA